MLVRAAVATLRSGVGEWSMSRTGIDLKAKDIF
jgi:hypothetical protein